MCVHVMLTLGVCFSLENYAIIWYFSFIIMLKKIPRCILCWWHRRVEAEGWIRLTGDVVFVASNSTS